MANRKTKRSPWFTHRAKKATSYYRKYAQASPADGKLAKGSKVAITLEEGSVVRFVIEAEASAGDFEPLKPHKAAR